MTCSRRKASFSGLFGGQLRFHLAEKTAIWLPAGARLAGDPRGQALLDAMDDEQRLIGPLLAVPDNEFTMGADRGGYASYWPDCGPGWPATQPTRGAARCH